MRARPLRRIFPPIPTAMMEIRYKYRHLTAGRPTHCRSVYNPLEQEGVLKLPGGPSGYSRSHNSVEEMSFELTIALPRAHPPSHCDPADLALVHRLVRDYPQETLHQLCERVEIEYHLTTSRSNLSRALRQLSLGRRKRSFV